MIGNGRNAARGLPARLRGGGGDSLFNIPGLVSRNIVYYASRPSGLFRVLPSFLIVRPSICRPNGNISIKYGDKMRGEEGGGVKMMENEVTREGGEVSPCRDFRGCGFPTRCELLEFCGLSLARCCEGWIGTRVFRMTFLGRRSLAMISRGVLWEGGERMRNLRLTLSS